MILVGRVGSVLVGARAPLHWRGGTVQSGIVDGPVRLSLEGFTGDEQVDRSVHGGPEKAVCVYPSEHLAGWSRELGIELPPGAFGENLSVAGLLEDRVCIGDTFALGETVVQVTHQRVLPATARGGRCPDR